MDTSCGSGISSRDTDYSADSDIPDTAMNDRVNNNADKPMNLPTMDDSVCGESQASTPIARCAGDVPGLTTESKGSPNENGDTAGSSAPTAQCANDDPNIEFRMPIMRVRLKPPAHEDLWWPYLVPVSRAKTRPASYTALLATYGTTAHGTDWDLGEKDRPIVDDQNASYPSKIRETTLITFRNAWGAAGVCGG
ncbi:hypothetical protein QBC46DRAFT_410335 [Diplogelasinospora grovesii]|uniref:Uncharacterized protein n=1 Tax=Diplogelasinospora grovesii TaxID=303347 RepID=A0AAN6S3A5_9PEZI|nr:hypothetical protein QBC46DRAFT_410335 [Diplogelasinospora grovesii]